MCAPPPELNAPGETLRRCRRFELRPALWNSVILGAMHPKPTHHRAAPGVHAFALLSGIEAFVRGTALAVYPLVMYRVWADATTVAQLYFGVGVCSLLTTLALPVFARRIPRRWIYTTGVLLYVTSAVLGYAGGKAVTAALLCHTMGTAIVFVCFNAYVLDHIGKMDFGRLETLRLVYAGLGWSLGPVSGVWLLGVWPQAPFVVIGTTACALLGVFWRLRIGEGRVIAGKAASKPLTYLARFLSQPRLVAGWAFTVIRSCGWWVYIVYVGIFAVQNGLGERVGGVAMSLANMGLFLAPLMLRWMQRRSVREAVRTGFLVSACSFILASLTSPLPWATVALLVLGAYFLILLDVCAGLPFMMSVKPSQRTEMSAVYSSFRDVSGILSPAFAWVVLHFTPVAGVFAWFGLALLAAWALACKLHPQLGVPGARRVRLRPG